MKPLHSLQMGVRALLLLAGLLLAARGAGAQAPAWQSNLLLGSTGNSGIGVQATTTDAANNVYVTGTFIGTVTVGGSTFTSLGFRDVFVAKWSAATSSFVWAVSAGGAGFEEAPAIAVNGTDVYIGGKFTSASTGAASMAFGAITLTGDNGAGFVAKVVETGAGADFAWAYKVESPGNDGVNALAREGNRLYVAGYFGAASVSFGPLALATGAGNYDVFVAKLTDAGPVPQFDWLQRAGSSGYDEATALQVSGPNVYVTGVFTGTAAFGPSTLTTANTSQFTSDLFVAKLTDAGGAGNWTWAVQGGGNGYDRPAALARSGNNLYVAGNFSGATFDWGGTALVSANGPGNGTVISDVFVAKLVDAGPTGRLGWAQQAGGRDDDRAYGLEASGTSLFVAGLFYSGTLVCGNTLLTRGGTYSDLYLAKLVDAGPTSTVSWAQQATGPGYMGAYAMTSRGNRVYVAGFFNGATGGFGSFTLANAGLYASYVVSVVDATLTATASPRAAAGATVFPSPAHGRATVEVPATAGAATATLTVLDALGRAVRTRTVPTNARTELDLTGLAPGVYALRVAAGGGAATRRLVVE